MVLIFLLPIHPASGIFGLSKCEKAQKYLNSEQSIGYENWKIFDELRDQMVKDGISASRYPNYIYALKFLSLIYSSDITLYKYLDKNKTCFSAKLNADSRIGLIFARSSVKEINTAISSLQSRGWFPGSILADVEFRYLRQQYEYFVDWKSGKKIG